MKNTIKFDYIISNPPYNIGNAITRFVVNNVQFESYINLMPLSCYKAKELYKTVKSLEVVNPKAFEDAAITDNLCICELIKDEIENQTYEDLAMLTYAPEYREFYKLNAKCRVPYEYLYMPSPEKLYINTDFQITARTIQNGVHKINGRGAKDIGWNISKDLTSYTWDIIHKTTQSVFLRFKTAKEHSNLCRFWYYNPLQNDLIKGLNSSGGRCDKAIPNIDYSIDRDYEHLTLEDIMQILREENDC